MRHLLLVATLAAVVSGAGSCRWGERPNRGVATAQRRPVRIVATGDILLADAMQEELDRHGYDFPFLHLARLVDGHDLLVGNLEGPITAEPVPAHSDKDYSYKARPEAAKALAALGFDLLCLANNHTLDYGPAGLRDTLAALEAAHLGHFGAGFDLAEATAGKVVEVEGLRVGLLGFMEWRRAYDERYHFFASAVAAGVAPAEEEVLAAAIARVRPVVDTLVVSFHWGKNYGDVTDAQLRLGRLAADLGADLVLGHGSHTVQGMEVRRGVPILYSLGNFTFGTPGRYRKVGEEWRHGFIADIRVERGRPVQVDLVPIATDKREVHFQPRLADPARLPAILRAVNRPFGTELRVEGNRIRWRE